MEQQNPEFEVPPVDMRLPKEELEVLLPKPESVEEPIFIGWRSEFIEKVGAVATKPRVQRTPAKKRTQSRPK
jgi:hypothetical protein